MEIKDVIIKNKYVCGPDYNELNSHIKKKVNKA